MSIKQHMALRSEVLKGHVNRYTIMGLSISLASILLASFLVSYQLTGSVSLAGIIKAQLTNPALWALDLTPFMFAYWGQSFFYELATKAEVIIENTTRQYVNKTDDLEVKLKYESHHDHLTGLPNARLLTQRINESMTQLKKDEQLVIIFISISDFNNMNYHFGNFGSNSLLTQFAEVLKSILLRPYMLRDCMGMNMVARVHGASFAFFIPRLRKAGHLPHILNELISDTSINFMIEGENVNIKTRAGIACYPSDISDADSDADTLLDQATLALFHAEKDKMSYLFYHPSMVRGDKENHLLMQDISTAINEKALQLKLQPIYTLGAKKKLIGAKISLEVLRNQKKEISLEDLITRIESTNLGEKLTLFMLKESLTLLEKVHKIHPSLQFKIPLLSFVDSQIPHLLKELLDKYRLPAHLITLEFTEKTCLDNQIRSTEIINSFANLGVKIAISDFGSGYASFTYLSNFPIKEVQLESSLISHLSDDEEKLLLVKAIVGFAHIMKLTVQANHIENEAIYNMLAQVNCNYGTGDYLEPPLTKEKFIQLLSLPNPNE